MNQTIFKHFVQIVIINCIGKILAIELIILKKLNLLPIISQPDLSGIRLPYLFGTEY